MDLQRYLEAHYLSSDRFAESCGISEAQLAALIDRQLVPKPSYVVAGDVLTSAAFGTLPGDGARSGSYHHPALRAWVLRAVDRPDFEVLAETFATNMTASLAALNRSTWAMTDSFDAHGRPIAEGLRARIDGYWSAFLNGVFGLCVADPGSEETIARKEVLQEKLAALTDNGSRIDSAAIGRADLTTLIDAYDRAAMPFAPREYPNSSRKRLVDDLREKLANLLP